MSVKLLLDALRGLVLQIEQAVCERDYAHDDEGAALFLLAESLEHIVERFAGLKLQPA